MSLATPLVDGMVVSRRAIGPLLRQTALNMCRYHAAHRIVAMEVHLQSVCFGPPGPRTLIIWYGINKHKSKKHPDLYYFVIFCCLFIYEN